MPQKQPIFNGKFWNNQLKNQLIFSVEEIEKNAENTANFSI